TFSKENDPNLFGEAETAKGLVYLNLNNPAIAAANSYSSNPEADFLPLLETMGHETAHLNHNMSSHNGMQFDGLKYDDKNLAAELLDEYSAQYTGIMMATGRQPSVQEMDSFWLTLVGRSKNDVGAAFYKELSNARQQSPMFDQVTNDIHSLLK